MPGVKCTSESEVPKPYTKPMQDVHRRVIKSFTTGRAIVDCIVKDTPTKILHRLMKNIDDI